MDRVRQSADKLAQVVPYDPKYIPAKIMNSANENPLDVPEAIKREMLEAAGRVNFNRYPDPLANELRDAIAAGENERLRALGAVGGENCATAGAAEFAGSEPFTLTRENVLVGNGGDELLFNLALTYGGPGRKFLNTPPTFSVYTNNAMLTGTEIVNIPRLENFALDEKTILKRAEKGDIDFMIITSPNNPTGDIARAQFVEQLLNSTDALVMLDEAYFEFAGETALPLLARHKNLIILRTFSKAFSLAGVRLGYVLAHAEVIREFLKVRQPYSVDAISQEIAKVAYAHRSEFYAAAQKIAKERERMYAGLCAMGAALPIEVFPSRANYLLVRMPNAASAWQKLFDAGILIRDFSHAEGLKNCLRISVGTPEENDALLCELKRILEHAN